ncbi:type II/IV secretion system protein [Candidatus Azambacteria bacterium]|nr:type II/IV secretion system protein [Candidatus Azambacteria bacterium]
MDLKTTAQGQLEKLKAIQQKAEEDKAKKLAEELKLPYLNLHITPINPDILAMVPKEKAVAAKLGVFQKKDQTLLIATFNPTEPLAQEIMTSLTEKKFKLDIFIVTLSGLKNLVWPHYRKEIIIEAKELGEIEISAETIKNLKAGLTDLSKTREKFKELKKENTTQVIELILAASLANKASDLHFQPEKLAVRLRFRIDGALEDIFELTPETYHQIKNRFKLVSGLSINIIDIPQDGRFTIKLDEVEIEVRVSILPSGTGEGIVMRVLDPSAISVPLEKTGLTDLNYKIALAEISRPNGIILLTGPTGSGKTTTLYAFLNKLNTPDVKIITVEDPVEYKLQGISQTQIEAEKGLTFGAALRSILRQDPNIILVGEMRDQETSETALQAALTGHLVFSTLHTNDAAGAIPRLIDLGIKGSTIAPALNLIIAQRLIRKICLVCRETIAPTAAELEKLSQELKNINQDILASYPKIDQDLKIYQAKGCNQCNHGFKGRLGIHELLRNTDEIKNAILTAPNQFEIKKIAIKEGMLTLKQDGYLKVLQGITTLSEIEDETG